MQIDPRRLRFLLAVARTGGVLAAADELGVSASAVSQQLARLEAEVGRILLDRTPRGAVLTAAGHALAETAEEIERSLDDAWARLAGEDSDPVGSAHLGTFQTFLVTVLLPHLPAWRERFPRIHLDIVESDRDTLLRSLRSGDLDLAVVEFDAGEPFRALTRGVVETPLLDEPWKLVVPTGTVITGDVVDLARLTLPWLGVESSAASWQAVRRVRRSLGVRAAPVHTFANFSSALALVAAGEGCTLLPSLALHMDSHDGVEVIDVPGLGTRRIVLRHRATGDAESVEAVEAVAGLVKDAAAQGQELV